MALQRQTVSIPVAGGLDTKTDPFQTQLGSSLELENARFQKTGKLSKRFGQSKLTDTANTGLLSSNTIKGVISDAEYLAAITSTGVYGYSQGDNKWFKQSRLGATAKISTEFVAKSQFNQTWSDFDMTSDGTHYAFSCLLSGSNLQTTVSVVLQDAATGLKKSTTLIINSTAKFMGPKVAVVKSSGVLYVYAFIYNKFTNTLDILKYDENLSLVQTIGTTISPSDAGNFDICKDSTNIYLAYLQGTTLNLRAYDFNGAQTAILNTTNTNGLAALNGFGRGVSICQTANNIHIAWIGAVSPYLRGFTKSLTASVTEVGFTGASGAQKVSLCPNGSKLEIITDNETWNTTSPRFGYNSATFTTTYSIVAVTEWRRLLIAARPFIYNSEVWVLLKCNEAANKSFYLCNITQQYIAQVFSPQLAIFQSNDNLTADAYIPNSVIYNGVLRSNIIRTSIIGGSDVLDVIGGMSLTEHDFNTSIADGCKAKVGESLYYVNGITAQLDKLNAYDNGFVMVPLFRAITENAGTANPNVASKTFSYIAIYEYYTASGERVQSGLSDAVKITTTASAASISVVVSDMVMNIKNKNSLQAVNESVSVAIYRTQNNGSVYFRLASIVINGNTGGSVNYADTASDASIQDGETLYTTGGVIENSAAPAARFAVSGGNRLFLGGLEEKDEIAYSKKQLFGVSVEFNDLFRIRISSGTNADKSKISALGYMDGKLIIFRQQSIFFVNGDGPNDLGQGGFTEPEIIQSDVGCTDARSVLSMPSGLMFKSRKGIYLLTRGLSVEYIGAPVEAYNSESIIASILSDKYSECRFYTSTGKCLVYNYVFNTWSVFTNQTSIDADIWMGNPVIVKANRVYKEDDSFYVDDGEYQSMMFTSPWIKFDLIQGYIRTYQLWILGTFKSDHILKCRVYWDYNDDKYQDYSLVYDKADSPQYQFQISLPVQKVESIKFQIYDDSQSGSGESYDLSNIQIEVGVKAGGYKLAASKSY